MRVLYVLSKGDYFMRPRCGSISHALGVCDGLTANGAKVTVLSGPDGHEYFTAVARHRPVEHIALAHGGSGIVGKLRWGGYCARELRCLLSTRQFDVVMLRYASSNTWMFKRLMREFPHIMWVVEINSFACHQVPWLPRLFKDVLLRAELSAIGRARSIYVVSQNLRKQIVNATPSWQKRIMVCPNGGPQPWPKDALQQVSHRPVRLAYLGVFHSYYEYDVVLKAFQLLSTNGAGAELHFFGDGPRLGAVRQDAAGMPGVVFHGRYKLDHIVRTSSVHRNTILLLPHRKTALADVQSPIKLFEYMALGLPIIASDVDSVRDVLCDRSTAMLYRPGDHRDLANAMMRMVQNPEQRYAMADRLSDTYSQKHTWEARMGQLLEGIAIAKMA